MYLFAIPKNQALESKKMTDMRCQDSYPALAIKTIIPIRCKLMPAASYCHYTGIFICEMSTGWAFGTLNLQTSVFQFVRSSTSFWF